MKRKYIYALTGLSLAVLFWLAENIWLTETYVPNHSKEPSTGLNPDYLPLLQKGEGVKHKHYRLSYNEAHEQANWVAYTLKKKHLTHDDRKRPYFIEDPKVKTKSADWRNYKGSGYDRGHLCPAGDRRFSLEAYNETFYTSNVSPQNREFNAGIWNRLEQQVRYWAKTYGEVFVITGGVLKPGLKSIGDEDVSVPRHFYKIVVRGTDKQAKTIAFLMPNRPSEKPLAAFAVSVDRLEELTGIDFFAAMDNDLENRLEAQVDRKAWKKL
jgi:endonuclease G